MTPAQRLLKRAFAEKTAFVEMGADGTSPQASGPGGAPVDPTASAGAAPPGASPLDPAGAMAPPAADGAAPMDPMAAGAPPADPMAAGAPPVDPAAAGAPPADPMAGLPPPPPEAPPINNPDTDVDNNGKPDTMVPLAPIKDFAVGLIEAMKGKKTQDAMDPNAEAAGAAAGAPPGLPPGPVTGLPGDMSAIAGNGPLPVPKTASILGRTSGTRDIFAKRASTLDTQLSSKTPAQGPGRFETPKPLLENSKPSDVTMKIRETTETKPSTVAPDKLESAGKPVDNKTASVWDRVFH